MCGGKTIGWSFKRHVASFLVSWFTRHVLRVPVQDASSGYRAIRLQGLKTIDLEGLASGYAFFEDFLWFSLISIGFTNFGVVGGQKLGHPPHAQ